MHANLCSMPAQLNGPYACVPDQTLLSMPSTIVPIEQTRDFSVRPAQGLRYGNFEGVNFLPPLIPTTKIGLHSIASLNNQQIYRTVCDWCQSWRPWQQRMLLCGIASRYVISGGGVYWAPGWVGSFDNSVSEKMFGYRITGWSSSSLDCVAVHLYVWSRLKNENF